MLTPCFWPEVRRGTERMVHEVSRGLIARGHTARVITSHRGLPGRGEEEGVPVLRVPRPPDERLRRRRLEDHMTHVPLAYLALRGDRYDVAHAWFPTDALAAARLRRKTGAVAVHSYMGIPTRHSLMARRKRLDHMVSALRDCDVTVALSRYAAEHFQNWFGYDAPVIPPPVDVETFRPGPSRTPEPTVVCAASLDEPRKRADLLVRAFARVRRELPAARLILNRPRDPVVAARIEDPAGGVELAAMDDRAELARLYASSWVSVLPSFEEAFGLVLAEALACGTPGVGSSHGGIPEVLDRDGIGVLFDGDEEEALARALLEGIELTGDPATAEACRARALELSTERCVEAYEALYERGREHLPSSAAGR